MEEKKMSQYPIPAVGVFVFHENGIYMIKKGRGIFKDQWCTPGGKIEFGEDIINTVHREVLEETNLEIENIKFITYEQTIEYDDSGNITRHFVFFNFQATVKSGIPVAADDAAEIKLIPLDDLSKIDLSAPTIRTFKLLGIFN
jgi:8-oxo-dGTP diphosphatase